MSSIDERIVEMKFNNNQFEQGIRKTMSSLEGLKKGLNLSNSAKGIQDLEKAGRSFSLEPMANAVQTVASKFSAMSVVAITAIASITNKALQMGKTFVAQFTVDPIKAGLQEYETNLNSIQTILANTQASGATLADVNATLQELNAYSDQTIYNFAEMARNIGTFTAAGVDLKTSAASIKGIANLAALSGSNSQQAAGAMYQLSQAIASGKVSLMDWNSVVNAGMGGTVFQRALAETAVAMGKLDSSAVSLSGDMKTVSIAGESFRDSISATNGESWLSSEVLTTTLSQFTGDLTDAELAAQGFNEAQIKAIQQTAATAKGAATEVKTISGLMDTLKESAGSGWSQTWQLIIGDFEEAKAMWTGVNNVLSGMIGASADARNAMLSDWKELGGRTVLIEAVKNAFDALMRIVTPIKDAFREIFPPTTGQQLYNLTVSLKNFTEGLKINGELAGQIQRIFRGLFAALDIGRMIIMGVFDVLGNVFKAFSKGDSAVVDFAANFGDVIVKFRDALKNGQKIENFFNRISFTLVGLVTGLKNVGGFIKDLFQGKFKGSNGVAAAMDNLRERFAPLKGMVEGASKAWDIFLKAMQRVADFMAPLIEMVQSGIRKLGSAVSEAIESGDYSGIFDALNTGLFAAIALGINKFLKGGINIDMGGGLVDSIKDVFGALNDTLGVLQANIKADTLLKIAAAVGVLTVSVVAISMIDSAALTKSLTAITVMFGQLMGGLALLDKVSGDMSAVKMGILAGGLILLAGAMVVLSIAVKNLSSLDWEELAKGLSGVIVMLGAMSGTAKLLKGNTAGLTGAGIAMIAMSTGLVIMAAAVKDFADMDWEELGKGLVGAAGGMIILAGASKILSTNSGGTLLASVGMIAMAAAMKILASALGDFAEFEWDEIGRGLVAMAGAVVILTAALMVIPPTALVGAAGLVIASYSLIKFAEGMEEFAKMSWGEIGKSVTLLFAVLLLVAAALLVIPPTGLLGAASLIIVGESMVTFAEAMQKFGEMSWGEIGKAVTVLFASLLLLAAGLTVMLVALPGAAALWVAIEALKGLPPVVEALAALAWEDVKKGLEIVALALGTLAAAGLLIVPALPGLIGLGIAIGIIGAGAMLAGIGVLAFSTGIASLAVSGAAGAAALKAMADTIIGLIPTAMQALAEGIVLMAGVISNAGPEMTAAMTTLMLAILTAIDDTSPQILTTMFNLVLGLVNKIAENYPKFVDAGIRMITSILNGIAKNMGPIITAGTNVIVAFLKGIQQNMGRVTDEGADTVIAFVRAVASTIRTRQAEMRSAGMELAMAIADGMTFGLASKTKSLASKAANMANTALTSAKIALGIASPSKEFHKLGVWSGEGLAGGIDDSSHLASRSSKKMAEEALKSLSSSLSRDWKLDHEVGSPVIRPVLDLSQVTNDAKRIQGIVSGTAALHIGKTVLKSHEAANSMIIPADEEPTPENNEIEGTTVYNQYISSPKAVSPAETYRQTRNLLSVKKGGLKGAHNG